MLRSDCGGEYLPNEFKEFCKTYGIIHEITTPYFPQQNVLVEKKNRTLTEIINYILISSKLLYNIWEEALLTSCHNFNSTPFKK